MAERSYNGRVINQNPNMIGRGSTTSENAWVGDAQYLWRIAQTTSGNNILTEFTEYNGRPCIKMAVDGLTRTGGTVGQIYVGNLAEYAGATINVANLQTYGIKVKPNYTYKISVTYHLESIGADTGSTSFFAGATYYNTNGIRNTSTPSNAFSVSTATTDWTTSTGTFIQKQSGMNYIGIRIGFTATNDPTTNGNGVVYISNISLEEVLPTRNTATSRSTASNRVKVRDMGTALSFDGVDDVVTVKKNSAIDILPDSCSAFTISSIFFYQTSSGTDATISRYGKDDSLTDTNSGYWLTIRNTDGLMRLGLGNGSAREYETTINLRPNNWYFMDFVFENGQVKAYNRGQLVATQTWSLGSAVDFTGSNWFTIGAINSAAIDSEFKGIIKMHRLFDRALTAQESLDQYLNNIRYENVSELLFNEASGTTAYDTSGNGNDGTITGATYTTDVPLTLRGDVL